MRYLLIILVLAGCDVANRVQASNDLMESKRAYKECLAAKSNCSAEKSAYEADVRAYGAIGGRGAMIENTINNR